MITSFHAKSKKKQKNFCPIESKYKLVIYERDNTRQTFYSFLREDKKLSDSQIMDNMLTRANRVCDIKKALFYKGKGKNREMDGEFTMKNPLVKLVVYDWANNRESFPSLPSEEALVNGMHQRNWNSLFQAMNERVLQQFFMGSYKSATFYNQDDKAIFRISP